MTFWQAMAAVVTTPGVRARRAAYDPQADMAVYTTPERPGVVLVDSDDQVGIDTWVAATDEQTATDWYLVEVP